MIGILSFPRSGNHFVRYIVEYLTSRSTIGCTTKIVKNPNKDSPICCRIGPELLKDVEVNNPIACKYHFVSGKIEFYVPIQDTEKLILILRHPIETWLSHNYSRQIFTNGPLSKSMLEKATIDSCRYLENLEFYSQYEKPKVCLYYEDLLSKSPSESILKLANILDVEEERVLKFINNYEKFRADSLKSLLRKPVSSTSSKSINFYSEKLDDGKIKVLRNIFSNTLNHSLLKIKYNK